MNNFPFSVGKSLKCQLVNWPATSHLSEKVFHGGFVVKFCRFFPKPRQVFHSPLVHQLPLAIVNIYTFFSVNFKQTRKKPQQFCLHWQMTEKLWLKIFFLLKSLQNRTFFLFPLYENFSILRKLLIFLWEISIDWRHLKYL